MSKATYSYHAAHRPDHTSATFNIGGQFNKDPKIWNQSVAEHPMPFKLEFMDISMALTPISIKDDPPLAQKRDNPRQGKAEREELTTTMLLSSMCEAVIQFYGDFRLKSRSAHSAARTAWS